MLEMFWYPHKVHFPDVRILEYTLQVFSKCTVHSCSGSNRLRLPRHAWQLRLISGHQEYDHPTYSYPEMGSKFRVQGKYLEGPNHIKIWPETVPSEVDKNLEKGIPSLH